MDNVVFVYMTAKNKAEALAIGNELVTQGLAACVNIIDQINSIYKWDGELHYDNEAVMIAKTAESRLYELIEIVKANHSDECPCIVSIPVSGGNTQFLDWVTAQVNQ